MSAPDDETDAYRRRLAAAGLGDRADALVGLARPSVRLVTDPEAEPGPSSSHLGGTPLLPAATPWPRKDGRPLSLIAQIDLAEVAALVPDGDLPPDGLLAFFYDAVDQEAWGFDPDDRGAAVVLHTPADGTAEHRDPPADLDDEGRFPAVALRPTRELTFAPWESFDLEQVGRIELEAYLAAHEVADGTVHRLLGHPEPVQGDMQLECQLVTHGLFTGDETGYRDPRAAALQEGAAGWRLLLQVDTEEDAGMMWGDVGRLYYWIEESDLAQRRWDRCWLILQCY